MSNQLLGNFATQEIRESMRGLVGKPAKAMAVRLAERHGVVWQHIYKMTKDLRPERKKRADAGKSVWKLEEGTDLWKAVEFVIVDNYDPDLALMTAKERGYTNLPSLATFQKILAEHGLNRKARRANRVAYRRWQAEFPGQIFQVDVTALKERWIDLKTRKILRISEADINTNHPNDNPNLVPIWQIMLSDDFSRRRYLKYVHTNKITSDDIVQFLVEAFHELGVPHVLYTDNGMEFRGRHTQAQKMLDKITEDDGGYKHWTHKPYNAKATGKVEVAHQFVEKMNKLLGTAIREGRTITMDLLQNFAVQICKYYNEVRVHRATGQTPMNRWFSRRAVIRKLPAEIIESALLSDVFDSRLNEGMFIERKGSMYKVPATKPFVDFITKKVKVVVPPNIDYIIIGLPTADKQVFDEHIIPKVAAVPDVAGEFKRPAESTAQQLTKRIRETRQQGIKEIKQNRLTTNETAPIPFIDTQVETPKTNVANFPHAEIEISAERVAEVAALPASLYVGKQIDYWQAVGMFADHFQSAAECREFLLTVFADFDERLPSKEVESAIEGRESQQQTNRIYAVK